MRALKSLLVLGRGKPKEGGCVVSRSLPVRLACCSRCRCPAAAAKAVAVPLSKKVLHEAGNSTETNKCGVFAYLEWQAQKGAQAWRIEYLWSGLAHEKANQLKPPFHDDPHSVWGWAPPEGAHWYRGGTPRIQIAANPDTYVDCGDFAADEEKCLRRRHDLHHRPRHHRRRRKQEKRRRRKKNRGEKKKLPQARRTAPKTHPGRRGRRPAAVRPRRSSSNLVLRPTARPVAM